MMSTWARVQLSRLGQSPGGASPDPHCDLFTKGFLTAVNLDDLCLEADHRPLEADTFDGDKDGTGCER